MSRELSALMERHNVTLQASHAVPLAPPSDRLMWMSGIASTTDLDLDRIRFCRYAFPLLSWESRYHCSGNMQVAGQIERLNYDDQSVCGSAAPSPTNWRREPGP
jgi:hypothetical protein